MSPRVHETVTLSGSKVGALTPLLAPIGERQPLMTRREIERAANERQTCRARREGLRGAPPEQARGKKCPEEEQETMDGVHGRRT